MPLLETLDVDPDIVAAAIVDADGRKLAAYRSNMAVDADEGTRALDQRQSRWGLQFLTVEHALPTGSRITIVYDTHPAWRRALLQLALYSGCAILTLLAAMAALRSMFLRQMKPMRQLADVTAELAGERYGLAVPGLERPDEIGVMARAIDSFKTRLLDRQRLRDDAEVETRNSVARHAVIDQRVETFRSAIGRSLKEVGGLSDQMQVAADSLASIANQTATRADSAVLAIRKTSANVSTVAAASEDLSASIREIERQVDSDPWPYRQCRNALDGRNGQRHQGFVYQI